MKIKEIKDFGGLALFCIEADFNVQIRIVQHFSRSTRFKDLCTAPNSKFWKFLTIFEKKTDFDDEFSLGKCLLVIFTIVNI